MAFAVRFCFDDGGEVTTCFGHYYVRTLAEAKAAFYREWRHALHRGAVRWVTFKEVVAPVSVMDAALGRRPRAAASSSHHF